MFETYLPVIESDFNAAILVAIGFAVGVLASFFGVGGGWIITPSLNIFGFPMPFAIGTGLANIAGQSAMASAKHRRMGNVDHHLGIATGLAMIVGLEGGKRVILALAGMGVVDSAVRLVYFFLLGGFGSYMLYEYVVEMLQRRRALKAEGEEPRPVPEEMEQSTPWLRRFNLPPTISLEGGGERVSLWAVALTGLSVGFLAGILGSGGGFALVPMFVYLLGVPTYVAVSTSLTCVAISGAYGAFTYAWAGQVSLIAALWLLLGAAVGTQLGGAAIRYVKGYGVRSLYALMLLLAAAGVAMKQMGMNGIAAITIVGGALLMCTIIIGRMIWKLLR